jgi:hypothetical protein
VLGPKCVTTACVVKKIPLPQMRLSHVIIFFILFHVGTVANTGSTCVKCKSVYTCRTFKNLNSFVYLGMVVFQRGM